MLMRAMNSWRRQLSLPLILPRDIPDHTVCFHLDEAQVLAVNIGGQRIADAGPSVGMPPGHPPISSGDTGPGGDGSRVTDATAEPGEQIRYTVPSGWKPGQRVVSRGGFTVTREVALVTSDGDQNVEIAATLLSSRGASLPENVNRWRMQVGLEPVAPAEVEAAADEIPVGSLTGKYVELIGPGTGDGATAVFGAIAIQGNRGWVFTLKGDADLAKRQRESFRTFLESIQFAGEDGADHGN
jgi:hypothetical protein